MSLLYYYVYFLVKFSFQLFPPSIPFSSQFSNTVQCSTQTYVLYEEKKEVFFADTLYYFEHVKILLSVAKSNGNQKLVCLERAYCFVKRNKDNELCVSQSLAFFCYFPALFLPWKLLSKPGRRGFHKRCRLKVHLATKEKGERECSSLQKQANLRRRVGAY